jgi:hypothetical protein
MLKSGKGSSADYFSIFSTFNDELCKYFIFFSYKEYLSWGAFIYEEYFTSFIWYTRILYFNYRKIYIPLFRVENLLGISLFLGNSSFILGKYT